MDNEFACVAVKDERKRKIIIIKKKCIKYKYEKKKNWKVDDKENVFEYY